MTVVTLARFGGDPHGETRIQFDESKGDYAMVTEIRRKTLDEFLEFAPPRAIDEAAEGMERFRESLARGDFA